MQPLPKSLNSVAAILLASVLASCDAPGPKPGGSQAEGSPVTSGAPLETSATTTTDPSVPYVGPDAATFLALPLRKVLTDNKGRSLEVTILAKTRGFLAVQRVSDQSNFSLPIADLSADSQAFLQTVAESSAAQIAAAKQTTAPDAAEPTEQPKSTRRASWNKDLSMALSESQKENLPIYLLFTGTSWCPPCKSLESSIHNTAEFQEFADKNLVLMKVDIPRSGSSNSKKRLIKQYSVHSYPTVIVLDTQERVLKQKSGYSRTEVAAYNKELARIIRR